MKKSIFLFFAAILCAIGMNAATPTKIYLNAESWGYSEARYAAYFFDPAKWVDMKKVDGETFIYEVDVPAGYTKVIFVRMNGGTTENNWDNKWNQTGNLDIPTDGRNIFKPDDWNEKTTTWSTYTPPVTHTFTKNSTLYIDFRAITDKKGANYPKAGSVGIDYSANAGGTVIPVTFTADVKWAEGAEFMKTEKGDWASIPFKAPAAGQNCAQVAADGKSYTWTTFSEPSVTLSLDKTEADAGTEVTVTLTATADNVSGEVTYAFQYSTDNATWNNITATGNTATQTFAAETRYYKVTMTNGGTTKEATAKFSAIKFHVIGSWDSWTAHNEVVEGSKTITLEANKTYEYKITNGTWDLSWGNDGTMERSNCTDWSFKSNNNAKIKTDEAGDYVFNVSRNAEGEVVVSVTYPEQTETPEPVVDVYTVVGSSALCGSEWNPSDASNDMTLVDGLYVWTKENVTLTGNTTFKIVKNHDYGQGEWPSGYGQNATIDISTSDCTEGGTYSIKITFDPTTGTITPTIESCEAAEEPIVHTYTVVGQAVLCESEWNPSDASNDMTLVDGLYVWTKENVELRSNAEFRIVKDHAYDEAYPSGNYVIDLANYEGAAIYNVTITFNAETKEITVAMEKTGDVTPVVYTYYLMGVNGDWTTGIEMVRNEANTDAEEYMLTCQPVNGEVKIKRLDDKGNETWYGGNSLKTADGSLGTNTSTDGGDGNILLEEGIYNFYFNTADGKLWIAVATDCETEPTTVTLTYDLTTDAVSNKMGRRYVTAEDATLGNVQIILPSFNTETTEYTDASLVVGDETLGATATYTADTDNNKETYTATATSEDGTTTYNVTMTIIVPATQIYTFIATIGAEATVNEYEWGTEYSINGSGYLDDTPVEFELLADNMGFLSGTINGVDVYCSDATTNTENELGETYLSVMATAQDAVGNTYNIQMWVLIVVEKVEIVITEEIDVTLGNLKLEPMGNMAMVTADNLSFWMTLLETENYYGTYESDMFSNIWYGGDDDAIQLQAYGEGIYTSNALTVSFISEPDAEGNATKYNFTLTRKTITLTTGDNSTVIAANIGETVNVKIERSFTANAGYYTLCVPFNMDPSVIGKAYSLGTITEHVTGEGINIELKEESELSAGMPYLVLPKANMSELVVENVTIESDEAYGQNVTNEEETVKIFFEGFYSASGQTNGTTQYYVGNNGYLYNEVVDIRGLCGLFTITDENGDPLKVRARVVTREEVETGIDNNQLPNTNIQKVLENGQLIIIREGVKYNVQGQVIK